MSLWYLFQSQFILQLISIPAHLTIIAVTIKNRNAAWFVQTPCFMFLRSVCINDFLCCICENIWNIWCFYLGGRESHPRLSATIGQMFYVSFFVGNEWALFGIAIIRVIFICFTMQSSTIWKKSYTRILLVVQWGSMIVHGLLVAIPEGNYEYSNKTLGDLPVANPIEPISFLTKAQQRFLAVHDIMIASCIIMFYLACVIKVTHAQMTSVAGDVDQQRTFWMQARICLQAGMITSFLMVRGVLSAVLINNAEVANSQTFAAVYMVSFYGNFYTGPFIVSAISKDLRKYVKILYGIIPDDQTSVIVSKTAEGKSVKNQGGRWAENDGNTQNRQQHRVDVNMKEL